MDLREREAVVNSPKWTVRRFEAGMLDAAMGKMHAHARQSHHDQDKISREERNGRNCIVNDKW